MKSNTSVQRVSFVLFFALVSFLPGLRGQSDESQDGRGQDPIRIEVDAVNILVTVNEKDTGAFVTNLGPRDFSISEDGVRQEISNFSQQTNLPLTIALCIDSSSSVKLKLEFEKEAATDFLFAVMRPTDRALLVEFDTGVTLLHDFTSNPNDLLREIESLRAGGGTSLYDAVYLVTEQKMLEEEGRKTLVILSDGSDLTSKRSFEEALRMAYKSEAAVYAISTTRFGAEIDHEGDKLLKRLTESTGGTVFFPHSSNSLGPTFETINKELRSQYNIAYVPKNKKKDGEFRKLEVKVRRDDIRVRHRKGYFAPLD